VELLRAAARQRLVAGQEQLDLGLGVGGAVRDASARGGAALPIRSSRMRHLWDALDHAYTMLGFDAAVEGDEVFRDLVLARIIEPAHHP
jgi:hypothetical protein